MVDLQPVVRTVRTDASIRFVCPRPLARELNITPGTVMEVYKTNDGRIVYRKADKQ